MKTNASAISKDFIIDNVAAHPTPEGLMLTLMPAGILPRLTAWLIDLAIRAVVFIVLMLLFRTLGATGAGFAAIGVFLLYWLYPVYFEVYKQGMTPGKKNQGLYVCHDDGTPITLQASLIRNLLRVADFLPFMFAAGAISILFNKQSQRIGDMIAGTLVVYHQQDDINKLYNSIYGKLKKPLDAASINQQSTDADGEPVYDPASPLFVYPLKLNEQQALVAYLERIPFLAQPRRYEIASVLNPLVIVSQNPINQNMGHFKKQAVYRAVIQRANQIVGASSLIQVNEKIGKR